MGVYLASQWEAMQVWMYSVPIIKIRLSWINTDSGNGLLLDGFKLSSEPMLTYHQMDHVAFSWMQFHRNCSRFQFYKWVSKLNFEYYFHISQGPTLVLPNQWPCFMYVFYTRQSYLPWFYSIFIDIQCNCYTSFHFCLVWVWVGACVCIHTRLCAYVSNVCICFDYCRCVFGEKFKTRW